MAKIFRFFGDSITAGLLVGANQRWSTLLATRKGAWEVNYGLSGNVLENGTVCGRGVFATSTIPTKTADDVYAFFAYGVNDIGVNNTTMTPAGFETTLDGVVTSAISKGWAAENIVLVTPSYMTSAGYNLYVGSCSVVAAADATRHQGYADAVLSVAQNRGTKSADVYTAMKNYVTPSSLLSDGIHPNVTGHDFIADYMEGLATLRKYYVTGDNKFYTHEGALLRD